MSKSVCWLDIESTGKSTATDRIIQLSLIKTLSIYDILDKKKLYFNNCGVPIHPDAFAAHGISEEMISTNHPFKTYASLIYKFIEECDIVGGFNLKQFDIPMLAEEFARADIDWKPKAVIDTSVIFKKKEPRNLAAAYKFYCGAEMQGAHDAENDVIVTILSTQGQVFVYGFDNLYTTNGILPVPIEDVLISESYYENEKDRIDFHNKIILNDNGIEIWNFGKYRDKNIPVKEDLNYCNWCLGLQDFPATTKNLIKRILKS